MSAARSESTAAVTDVSSRFHRRLRGGRRLRDGRMLYWWLEVGFVAAFYFVYSTIRNLNDADEIEAFRHAREIIRLQLDLGIYHEQTIQAWALHVRPLIIWANYFYGSLHFVVSGGVMIYLYRKWTNDYPLWRNTLAVATAIALIGFAFYPLMPPRLLPHSYGFVDTLAKDPAIWSFNSGAVAKISNQYAAMPSVHCAWALWCACVLVPRLRHGWAKALAASYPVLTVTAIVITANHYVLDAAAGFVALGIGYVSARAFTRAGRGRPVVPVESAEASAATPLTSAPTVTLARDDRAQRKSDYG
jgi:PAP2 superfamily